MSGKGFKRVAAVAGGDDRPAPAPSAPDRKPVDPAVALAAAAAVAPTLPPTQVKAPAPLDPIAQLNLKIRASLIDQLVTVAEREGTTQKVIVCRALAAAGFDVHPEDLADRSNHRRRRA